MGHVGEACTVGHGADRFLAVLTVAEHTARKLKPRLPNAVDERCSLTLEDLLQAAQ